MECSTTELRQHARYQGIGPKEPLQAAGSCHKAPAGASTRRGREGPKTAKINARFPLPAATGATQGQSGSHFVVQCQQDALEEANHDPGPSWLRNRRLRDGWAKHNMRFAGDGTLNRPPMKDDQGKRVGKTAADLKDSRQARLKQALRENLKRRKSQARGRSEEPPASSETADASLDDAGGEKPGQ